MARIRNRRKVGGSPLNSGRVNLVLDARLPTRVQIRFAGNSLLAKLKSLKGRHFPRNNSPLGRVGNCLAKLLTSRMFSDRV